MSGQWIPVVGKKEFPASLRREGAFRARELPVAVVLRPETYKFLAEVERELGRLDERAERLPRREVLVRATQLHEAKSSFGIDGVHAAFREMLVADLPGVRTPPAVDPRLVLYKNVADDAVAQIRDGQSIGHTLLGRTAAMLAGAQDLSPAHWRTGLGWLGNDDPASAYLLTGLLGDDLRKAAERWTAWVDEQRAVPLIGKAALGHYQLMVLNPVPNTSHLARLYVVLEFIRAGALRDQTLSPSTWLDRNRNEYQRQLRAVAEHGDLDAWVMFFAEGVRTLCAYQSDLVRRVEALRNAHIGKLPRRNDALSRIVENLIGNPVFNHRQLAKLSGVTERYVYSLVPRLRRYGLIREFDKKKYRKVLEVPDVVRLLSLNYEQPPERDEAAFDQ